MHKLESVPGNDTHKIHWDFEIQTCNPIPYRILDIGFGNKKKRTSQQVDLSVLEENREKVKKKSKSKGKYKY